MPIWLPEEKWPCRTCRCPLRPEDLDRVSDIESRTVGHPLKGFLSKRFSVLSATPDGFLACAATEGGQLAGYGIARLQEGEFGIRGAAAVLDVIGVEPALQGKGIGKAVVAGIGEQMRSASNRAKPLVW